MTTKKHKRPQRDTAVPQIFIKWLHGETKVPQRDTKQP